MDTLVAGAWNALGVLWRMTLIGAPVAFLVWAAVNGRRSDLASLEKRKLEIEARSDASPSPISRGIDPGGR